MIEPSNSPVTGQGDAAKARPWTAATDAQPLDVQRELLLEESTANEKVISLWRLVFCLVAATQMVLHVAFNSTRIGHQDWVALGCIFAGVLYSALLFVIISQRGYTPFLSYISVGIDISLISGALLGLAMSGEPMFAVNNAVATPLYLLAISLAGLRYNPRVTVFAAALAALEYAGVVWYSVARGDLYNLADPLVYDQANRFGQFDLVMQLTRLVLIGSGGVIATFGVRRARELRTASILDALTQVFNRGFFDERFRHEFDRAERYGRVLSLVVVDVDNFKRYNDRNGHLEGDQVLREVADILRFGLRSTDTVARYGGEEFVALLPETSKEQAMALVERLRQRVDQHAFLHEESQPGGSLTISAGVATYPGDGDRPDRIFEYADQALYEAKRSGRNKVQG
ncbi:MAG: GGDEF domain-containing protein [Armatimonadetes bacterium]|nr:GGDEF domain-containing protein [Armatimonadota bacterium]